MPQFSDADLCAAGTILRDALTSDDVSSAVMFEAMSRVFLVKLLQRYGKPKEINNSGDARFTSDRFRTVFNFIQNNLEQTLSVDELAREAGMSSSHFSRAFKETLGSTPMQYVLASRLERSMKLMKDKARPLSEIAIECGFADQAHFTRSFKQVTGQTPRQYRNNL